MKAFCQTRQWQGTDTDISDWAFGTEGVAQVMQHRIDGKNPWKRKESEVNMYDAEHKALFNAIRSGQTINNGDYMCTSTLMGIMGRLSAYSGKVVYWDRPKEGPLAKRKDLPVLLESKLDLTPAKYEFGPLPTPPVAVPGTTKVS